jgi:hypothetical protein
MANRLYITPTKFEDARTGDVSYGWRACDDYWSGYSNMWDSIPDDDMEFLAMFLEDISDDNAVDTVHFHVMERESFGIGDNWYTLGQVKHVVEASQFDWLNDD